MTDLDNAAMAAISPLFPDACAPNVYEGSAVEYVVWNAYQIPEVYAERRPAAARYPTQVHYFLPNGKNPTEGKLALQRALFEHGFTWPSITNASDSEGQHYVLECDFINAGGVYGYS